MLIRQHEILVAVVDLNLPDAEGLEGLTILLKAQPSLRILVVSLNAEAAYATRALQLGAAGYLNKDNAPDDLVAALEKILKGGRYISSSMAELLADRASGRSATFEHQQLSAQEYRVLQLLAEGRAAN